MPSAYLMPSVSIPSASECPSVFIPSASESLQLYYSFGLWFTNILPCRQSFRTMTDGTLHSVSLLFITHIFCPYQLPPTPYFRHCFYTDGLWSTFPSMVMCIFCPGGKITYGIPRAAAHLMLWTRGKFPLAVLLMRHRFVSRARSFRI